MRKTNEEIDTLIAEQQTVLPDAAGRVDVHRGHITKSLGQEVKNRLDTIHALENQKETTTVKLRSGL